jgi:hypothetical protein
MPSLCLINYLANERLNEWETIRLITAINSRNILRKFLGWQSLIGNYFVMHVMCQEQEVSSGNI